MNRNFYSTSEIRATKLADGKWQITPKTPEARAALKADPRAEAPFSIMTGRDKNFTIKAENDREALDIVLDLIDRIRMR